MTSENPDQGTNGWIARWRRPTERQKRILSLFAALEDKSRSEDERRQIEGELDELIRPDYAGVVFLVVVAMAAAYALGSAIRWFAG